MTLVGQMIGHYRITSKIGAGGMGEVYVAEDVRLDRKAAIKLLPDEWANDVERRQRFFSEAKAASALNHPHVCVIYDVGETADRRPYIAMEYVKGRTLASMVRQGSLDIGRMVEIGIQVADALDTAHENGVVHRDIKPDNISLNDRGQVKVLDFGLAKRMPQLGATNSGITLHTQQTQTGQLLGTPKYMSPEQALGKKIDHRTDIFSLGVMLYELATGRPPFASASVGEALDKIVHSQPEAMARFNYDIPPELERITLKCMQKSADRRYQSARELLVDLRDLKRQLESEVSPESSKSALEGIVEANVTLPTADSLTPSDIYISCAQLDDQPLVPGKEGWVSQFGRNLKVRLEQLCGERVKIAGHPMPPGEAPVDQKLLEYLPNVKTMVSVVSPPFAKSNGCRRGVEEFWQTAERSGQFRIEDRPRLFKVIKTPVDEQELAPRLDELFRQLVAFEFYDRDPVTGRFREFDESFGDEAKQRYYERVYDLAYEISEVLKAQRGAQPGPKRTAGRTVYLAETTSDLQSERDQLRRELIEQGHAVLPDQALPLVSSQLEETIQRYLAQCDLAIHLVGSRYGLVPEGTDQSVVALQNSVAARQSAETGLERLVWMPRNIQTHDERQATFIHQLIEDPAAQQGADVIEDTLENLKEILTQKYQPEDSTAEPTSTSSLVAGAPRLYLICDQRDEAAVEPIEDFFFEQGIEVSLPDFEHDEAAVNRIHWQHLEACDAVLIYYGTAGKSWVDIKLRELIKAIGYRDGRPIPHQAVYVGPPFDRRKERFKTLSAEIIRQSNESFDSSQLTTFAASIKQGMQATA